MLDELTEQQKVIRDRARAVAHEVAPLIREPLKKREFPWQAVRRMQQTGLLWLRIPKTRGGEEVDFVSLCLAQQELAKIDVGLANLISDQTVPGQLLHLHGTEEQKSRFFRRTVQDNGLWCLAATEPDVGSDLGGTKTTAVRRGSSYVLNGHKTWASTGGTAQLYLIFASTDPAKKIAGLSAFVVERETPGFKIGREIPKIGWQTMSTTELFLENVEVPEENRIGKEGDGFKLFLSALIPGRLGIAAQGLGVSQAAFEYARDYTRRRVQFGRPVADFQAVRFMLADMATEIQVSELLTYHTARAADAGSGEIEKLSAMAKYYVSDVAMKITLDAIQLLGAAGYSEDHPVERMMRDAKGLQIADGTNQIMRVVVAKAILG